MKLKTYHAGTVRAALKLARVELGEDAVFLGASEVEDGAPTARFRVTFALSGPGRQAEAKAEPTAPAPARSEPSDGRPHWRKFVPPELTVARKARAKGAGSRAGSRRAVEPAERAGERPAEPTAPQVAKVAAPERTAPAAAEADPARPETVATSAAGTDLETFLVEAFSELRAELRQDLRDELATLAGRRETDRPSCSPAELRLGPLARPALATWFQRLLATGAPATAALDLVAGLEAEAAAGADVEALRPLVAERLAAPLSVEPSLVGEADVAAAALVGPPGAGKSLTLVKLAMQYGLARGRRVRLLRAGERRVGSGELLEAYAALLDLTLTSVERPAELAGALAAARAETPAAELILIDTPGIDGRPAGEELAAAIAGLDGVETHLTLDASVRPEELARAAERCARFAPARLLLTRMDALARAGGDGAGAVWGVVARSGLPLSYIGCGQQAPEDLREASVAEITDAVLGER